MQNKAPLLRCIKTAQTLGSTESEGLLPRDQPASWDYRSLAGRLVEISGRGPKASLTAAAGLVLEAQLEGEPVAWIAAGLLAPKNANPTNSRRRSREKPIQPSTFFAPDFARNGIDLEALAVVRTHAQDPQGRFVARVADWLIRSGAFGLVVIDLGERATLPMAAQGRIVSLAKRHDTAVVCLTEKPATQPSIGSMVSMRAEALRITAEPGKFRCKMSVVKDKKRGPNWHSSEVVNAPPGMH